MMRRVGHEEMIEALAELLHASGQRPVELSDARLDEQAIRYVLERRHGTPQPGVIFLADRSGNRPTAAAALAPSAFDSKLFGRPIGRLVSFEVSEAAGAPAAIRAVERAAIEAGFELIFARLSPNAPALAALLDAGFHAYGATLLYAGVPPTVEVDEGLDLIEDPQEIAEVARMARLAFEETHLSRDQRLDRQAARKVYGAWVHAEAERGATILASRRRGRVVAAAVCRDNPLAARWLGLSLWHIHLLAVHPRARGGGLGHTLAEAAASAGLARGAEQMQVGVDTGGVAAQRIYARLGLLPCNSSLALHRWLL